MTRRRGTQTERKPGHVEQLLDRMSADSFPASDPPQVEGFAEDGAPARNRPTSPVRTHPPPADVAVPGAEASPFDREGRYALGGAGEVVLSTRGQDVTVTLTANPVTLDPAALETLIAVLERHRPSLASR
jgi:hypothetical protein